MFASNIYYEVSGKVILDVPALEIADNCINVLMGPNGAGKTSLLRCLTSLSGRCAFEVDQPHFLMQTPYIFNMSVLDNALLVCKDREKVMVHLEMLGMGDKANRLATTLSGGEGARVALLRTLVTNPALALLDEPTASADLEGTALMEAYIKDCVAQGTTVLMTTHSPKQALRLGKYLNILCDGNLVEAGETQTVLFSPTHQKSITYLSMM